MGLRSQATGDIYPASVLVLVGEQTQCERGHGRGTSQEHIQALLRLRVGTADGQIGEGQRAQQKEQMTNKGTTRREENIGRLRR